MEAAFAKVDFRNQRFSLMWNFENRAFTEGQGGKTASAPPHSQVVKRRQVYFCEIRPAKTHSVPTSLGGAAMFCALFLGGHRTWPGSHCRSEIPQILWDLTAAARSPPPGFLGNCRGATVPTPAGGLPRSISVATEIDFGGVAFCTGTEFTAFIP